MGRFRRTAPFLVIALILALPALEASGALGPLNDLLALGAGRRPEAGQGRRSQRRAEPPLRRHAARAVRAGLEARAGHPGPRARRARPPSGLRCNVKLVGHQGTSGGFKVLRYIDTAGHECAFYDTALLFPINAIKLDTTSRRRRRARHVGPGAPGADRHADRAADALAARVAQPQPAGAGCSPRCSATRRPTRAWSRSTTSSRTAATRCCSRPRWSRGSATRAASRPTARPSTRPAPRARRSPRST